MLRECCPLQQGRANELAINRRSIGRSRDVINSVGSESCSCCSNAGDNASCVIDCADISNSRAVQSLELTFAIVKDCRAALRHDANSSRNDRSTEVEVCERLVVDIAARVVLFTSCELEWACEHLTCLYSALIFTEVEQSVRNGGVAGSHRLHCAELRNEPIYECCTKNIHVGCLLENVARLCCRRNDRSRKEARVESSLLQCVCAIENLLSLRKPNSIIL